MCFFLFSLLSTAADLSLQGTWGPLAPVWASYVQKYLPRYVFAEVCNLWAAASRRHALVPPSVVFFSVWVTLLAGLGKWCIWPTHRAGCLGSQPEGCRNLSWGQMVHRVCELGSGTSGASVVLPTPVGGTLQSLLFWGAGPTLCRAQQLRPIEKEIWKGSCLYPS